MGTGAATTACSSVWYLWSTAPNYARILKLQSPNFIGSPAYCSGLPITLVYTTPVGREDDAAAPWLRVRTYDVNACRSACSSVTRASCCMIRAFSAFAMSSCDTIPHRDGLAHLTPSSAALDACCRSCFRSNSACSRRGA